jgi:hypothetical protein
MQVLASGVLSEARLSAVNAFYPDYQDGIMVSSLDLHGYDCPTLIIADSSTL